MKLFRAFACAGLALVLSAGLMAGCKAKSTTPTSTAAVKYTEGSCCAKAAAAGKACTHPCCVEAASKGEVCKKCNPT